MEKLNRAQKFSILGSQNLGSRGGGQAPRARPPWSAPELTQFNPEISVIFPDVIPPLPRRNPPGFSIYLISWLLIALIKLSQSLPYCLIFFSTCLGLTITALFLRYSCFSPTCLGLIPNSILILPIHLLACLGLITLALSHNEFH